MAEICPVCLEIFRNPKFLPCHHTYCQSCIDDLVQSQSDGTFPCPSCRKATSLPPGGAAALQSNFYINKAPLYKAGPQDTCEMHRNKKLEFYCVECDETLCLNCTLTRHKRHQTADLQAAISLKKTNLQADQERLRKVVSKLGATSLQEESRSLHKRRTIIEKNIRNRRATIVAAADKQMEEALKSLESTIIDLDKDLVRVIEEREELSDLLQRVDNAIASGTAKDVISVAKETKSGRGSPSAVAALRPVRRPILRCNNLSTDVMIETARDYVGRVNVLFEL